MINHLPQRVAISAALTAPVAAIEMSRHFTGWPKWHSDALAGWQIIMALAATIVVFGPGWPLLAKGALSYFRGKLNMFSLIAPGVLITYFFSLFDLITPGIFPESFLLHGHAPVYFEAAAMITTLVLLGQWLESRAEQRTGDALHALAQLAPAMAAVIRDGVEVRVPIDYVRHGNLIQLRAGDRVPVDGPVIRGEITLDESMLTGESMPVNKKTDDQLTAGTIVSEGAAVMRAEQVGNETVLARIIEMVRQAQESKAPIQRIADRVTGKLVPVVLGLATLTFIVWWHIGPAPSLWYALLHAVTVLMITCPCALGLATPVSIMTGLGRGALIGILVKHAASMEKLASVDTLVLDKTGTLTTGRPSLHTCVAAAPGAEAHILQIAASLEQFSHHPLAMAIVEGACARGIELMRAEDFHSETGGGVAGRVHGIRAAIGRRDWLIERHVIDFLPLETRAQSYEEEGHTVVWMAQENRAAGFLVLADELKPDAAAAMQALKKRGMRLLMITGDNLRTARAIASRLAIDEVHAGVKPDKKKEHIDRLRAGGATVAMAGDGINDAPALASADVGISIGTGTDVAMASGEINLLHGNLMSLVEAFALSRVVMRNIKQNLFFAFAYNIIMIPVAAGVLYPWTGWMLSPMLASAAMSASSITVIANALRLRKRSL